MKHLLSAIFFLFVFFIMLLFPSVTLYGASNGLLLWFQILIPTLLPFLIITNLLIQSNSISCIVKFIGPFIQKVFHVSSYGSFAALTGLLCGYPIGAKVTAELVKRKQISLSEGNYLLSFCNQTSPAFISSFIVLQTWKDSSLLLPTLIIIYLSTFLCSLIFRKIHKISSTINNTTSCYNIIFRFDILDNSIMNAFETLTKIGGYIIICSIMFSFCCSFSDSIFLSLIEITTGIKHILSMSSKFTYEYIYVLSLCSFGGICSIFQTASVIQGSNLSIVFYAIEKLITALVTSLLSFLYITIILR